jgi:hypothetical protein
MEDAMAVRTILVLLLTGVVFACATKGIKQIPAAGDQKMSPKSAENATQAAQGGSAHALDQQDGKILDLSAIDAAEEANWMNPNNPPELKRQYQKEQFSIVLPEDIYPLNLSMSRSSVLLKFKNADAYVYLFVPSTSTASALLDINLNSLDLNQTRGFHDMTIDLKESRLRMNYMNDESVDGYSRYVQIRKDYKTGKMSVLALIIRENAQYQSLSQEYDAIVRTVRPPLN